MRITYASEPAPGARNEDLVATGNHFVVVLDGATAPPGDTGCIHGVPWLVRTLGGRLAQHLFTRPATSLRDILAEAIEWVGRQHPGCDLSHPDSPSSTVAMLRERGDHRNRSGDGAGGCDADCAAECVLDYLVLADSPVLLDMATGLRTILDERLAALPSRTVEAVRRHRNCPAGFWVASVVPEAAYEAVTGTVPRWKLRRAALLTDGATRLVERFAALTWAELMGVLTTEGPRGLIGRVRDAEAADAASPAPRRGKVHDDATAVLCHFD